MLFMRWAQPGAVWVATHARFKLFDDIPAPNPWGRRYSSIPRAQHRSVLATATLQQKSFHPQPRTSVQTVSPEPDETIAFSDTLLWLAGSKLEILLVLLNTDELA